MTHYYNNNYYYHYYTTTTYKYVEYLDHADLCIADVADNPQQAGDAKPVAKARGKSRPHQRAFLLHRHTPLYYQYTL